MEEEKTLIKVLEENTEAIYYLSNEITTLRLNIKDKEIG